MSSNSKMLSSEGSSDREGSETGSEDRGIFEFFGWVYHLGVNSIGHDYCHLRFLFVRGKYVEMYKRDPHENPGIKPITKGAVGHTLMVEELGRRRVNHGDLYAIRFYNRLDETRKGELLMESNKGLTESNKMMSKKIEVILAKLRALVSFDDNGRFADAIEDEVEIGEKKIVGKWRLEA
ncbi:hypothetical protein GIB67_031582 [Kingdonia uniflora]|uniref:Uncharacterized protein n=1 Tax=Kingdonia uniflora TaxID=39325 RepID=A0A7J7LY60_9MAGN|nr:hypothetical protein GIB67_031582 [Kingdonia uniflora]